MGSCNQLDLHIDEYHYGAWRETAKDLFETDDKSEASYQSNNKLIDYNENNLPITANHYLYCQHLLN